MYIYVDGSEKCLHTDRNEILNASSKSFVDLLVVFAIWKKLYQKQFCKHKISIYKHFPQHVIYSMIYNYYACNHCIYVYIIYINNIHVYTFKLYNYYNVLVLF